MSNFFVNLLAYALLALHVVWGFGKYVLILMIIVYLAKGIFS